MPILIGADPELFVKKNGQFHSAHGLVPGTKEKPYVVKQGAVQVDGMALEINITPADNVNEFCLNIDTVLSELRKMVPDEYQFEISSHAEFPLSHIEMQPKEALMLGCDPDYNAYTEDINPMAKLPSHIRTGGGHVHIGWTDNEDIYETSHFQSCCDFVKQLDYYLGLPFMLLEYDTLRANSYGKGGMFRPKPYGVEYRTLSNFWLKDSKHIGFVFEQVTKAFNNFVHKNKSVVGRGGYGRDAARNAIQCNSRIEAIDILKKYPYVISKKQWKTVLNGIDVEPHYEFDTVKWDKDNAAYFYQGMETT